MVSFQAYRGIYDQSSRSSETQKASARSEKCRQRWVDTKATSAAAYKIKHAQTAVDSLRGLARARCGCTRPTDRRRSPRPCPRAAEANAAHRRTQRLSVGAPRKSAAELREAGHREAAADDHDRHRAAARRWGWRAILVGLRPGGINGTDCGDGDARGDRHRAPDGPALSRHVRARTDRRRYRTDLQAGPNRIAHRNGRGTLNRQLPRGAAHVLSTRRAVHDIDAFEEHRVGGLGNRRSEIWRPRGIW